MRREAEARLLHRASHDPLTDLPNRTLFLQRLEQALAPENDGRVGLLFVDLDRFKFVNDSLGHEAGDRLLIAVAERVKPCLRPGTTMGRLGGDEFTVLLPDLGEAGEAEAASSRIVAALDAPFEIDGHELVVTASVALYRAKRQGKARWTVFDTDADRTARGLVDREVRLRQAIARDELRVAYQPQVELATARIVGVEALVRWEDPEEGLLPPAAFIPLAEETGLILPIGRWVLEEACRKAQMWQTEAGASLSVSVNLSACQFQDHELVDNVASSLSSSGLPSGRLTLEITESAIMADPVDAAATLHRLKTLGVKIAIDDFGTGYASLDYLRRFPLDEMKVDRAFIAGLGRESGDSTIVRAVVGLAHALGLAVVAEGVENTIQVRRLRELGCEQGQGFFFGRPAPAASIRALLGTSFTHPVGRGAAPAFFAAAGSAAPLRRVSG